MQQHKAFVHKTIFYLCFDLISFIKELDDAGGEGYK